MGRERLSGVWKSSQASDRNYQWNHELECSGHLLIFSISINSILFLINVPRFFSQEPTPSFFIQLKSGSYVFGLNQSDDHILALATVKGYPCNPINIIFLRLLRNSFIPATPDVNLSGCILWSCYSIFLSIEN